jgi:glycosyltransferase involved in cell wall biosynthesis
MKIVHVIDTLSLGGTENQLRSLLPDIARDHRIVLVTLYGDQGVADELPIVASYGLGFSGIRSLPRTVLRLRAIIAAEQPDLVRSQLYWSSVAARLATPRSVPLVFSIHSTMSEDGYLKRRSALWLEKLTYARRHHLLGVSRHVVADFERYVGLRGGADALLNSVDPLFLAHPRPDRPFDWPLRLVAVGNLKEVKNYFCLLEALRELPRDVTLDIYGEGHLRPALEREIAANGLNVRLRGIRPDLWNVLADYDLLVMASLHEGCPNAVIEGMAAGLPLLLSDIPVMREVSQGNALFFDPRDPRSLAEAIARIRSGVVDLPAMAKRGAEIVHENHDRTDYIERLNAIYARVVASAGKAAERRPS